MKSTLLALALVSSALHAAENPDSSPCDAVENDQQTLECSIYSKNTAEQLLADNFQALLERIKDQYADNPAQLKDLDSQVRNAQQLWLKLREADCAIEAFPAKPGSKAFSISQNDCMARTSDERSEFLESIAQE